MVIQMDVKIWDLTCPSAIYSGLNRARSHKVRHRQLDALQRAVTRGYAGWTLEFLFRHNHLWPMSCDLVSIKPNKTAKVNEVKKPVFMALQQAGNLNSFSDTTICGQCLVIWLV